MIRIKFILIVWLVGCNLIYSQPNLILNPSFELYDSCSSSGGNIERCTYWYKGSTNTTPDYFNICNLGGMTVPLNMVGYQHPKDGVGYIGIGFTQAVNLREAVVGKLNTTLQPGHSYCVGFYMNVANKYGYIVDEISLFFSKDSIHTIDYTWNNNSLTPQVNINIGGITDTLGWTYVSGSFVASGEEEFFILSNFQDNPNWFQYNDSSISTDMTTYYYIDSISLVDCTPPNFDIVIPNLLSPNGDGINDKYVILNLPPDSRVSFFNRWGNELYSTSNYLNEWDGKYMGNLLPTGTYFVVVQFSDGTTKGTFIELMY